MKKLLLTLIAVFFIAISLFSQSYIGDSKNYIMNDIRSRYDIENFSYESSVLSVTFADKHTAIYILDEYDKCNYYILVYNIAYLSSVVQNCNSVATKIGDYKWYLNDNGEYVYMKINLSSQNNKVIYLSMYTLEYEAELNNLLSAY